MLSISSEGRRQINAGAKHYFKATLLFLDGTTRELTEEDFLGDSISYTGGTSSSGKFEIGGCVIKSLKFTLNNFDRRFANTAWAGLRIRPYFGVMVSGSIEWVCPDVFYLVSHKKTGNVIVCEAYDGLKLLDEGTVTIAEGETAYAVINRMATAHGITIATPTFTGYNATLAAADEMTERQALAYILQRVGKYAVMKAGALYIKNLGASGIRKTTTFSREVEALPLGYTGARYTCEDGTVYTRGTTSGDGAYVYELKDGDNPLINKSNASDALYYIWNCISGVSSSYPGTVEILSDFTIEPGDKITIKHPDDDATDITLIVSNFTYKKGTKERITFDAEPRGATDLRQVNIQHTIYEAGKNVEQQVDAYTAAYRQFQQLISETMGVFFTEEQQQDGSSILYLHDKQDKSQSQTIWKMTANTISVSTDGGRTFNAAVDSSGNLITNVLYAIKVHGDVIEGGILTDTSGRNYWNLDTGEIQIQTKNGNYTAKLYSGFTQYLYSALNVGRIGAGTSENYTYDGMTYSSSGKGLSFGLQDGTYMSWSVLNGNNSEMKWVYTKTADGNLKADSLNSFCKVDLHDNNLYSAVLRGCYINNPHFMFNTRDDEIDIINAGQTKNLDFLRVDSISMTDGTISSYSNVQLQFRNGIFVGYTWP